MAHSVIDEHLPEPKVLVLLAALVQKYLPQAKEIEVVDEECAQEHEKPTHPEKRLQNKSPRRILNIPDDVRHWPPLPEEQKQHKACDQHIGAALNRLWNNPRPKLFET